jgi:N6-adenosine-specific RNA methylase IME4
MTNIVVDSEFNDRIPPLKPEEFADLEANILKDGKCHDPLSIWNGILVDGHNRYEICQKHSIPFSTVEVNCGSTRQDALLWIDRHQLGRRNISDDQRATIGKRVAKAEKDKALTERAKAGGETGGRGRPKDSLEDTSVSKLSKPKDKKEPKDRTRKATAKKLNVSERTLRTAIAIDKKAKGDAKAIDNLIVAKTITLLEGAKLAALPDDTRGNAIKAVASGTDVRTAVRDAKKRDYNARVAAAKPKPLEGKYRIIYADPCWKYVGLNQADEHGHAEAHYDCLEDDKLIWFRPGAPKEEYHESGRGRLVKDLADDDAVLFMWVTSPLLERCFPNIKAWGFDYKASFVWDKEKHVMGHYNSVRHEFLLICTKGSCRPDVPTLINSVQRIKRIEHSRKPQEFYDIIETLYDHGRKLELFARSGREGWDSIGNEIDMRAAA